MGRWLVGACVALWVAGAGAADAQPDNRVKGAVAGGVGGAVVAGPVGAVVGGVGGAVVGSHMDHHRARRHWRRRHWRHVHHMTPHG